MSGQESPSRLLIRLSERLFSDAPEQLAFVQALLNPKKSDPHIIWTKPKPAELSLSLSPSYLSELSFVEKCDDSQKPGQSTLFQEGFFYVLDFSSILAASVLTSTPQSPGLVLDVCASPGGKSAFSFSALHPKKLICNEVIQKRIPGLISNLKRCGISPSRVVSLDPKILSQRMEGACDLVIVDAPCTGQSLLAKGEKALGCFHPRLIDMNSKRQKRILTQSALTVKPGGYLAYMTCTYSREENEEVIDMFLKKVGGFVPAEVPLLKEFQSAYVDYPAYRLFPQSGLGAGFFSVLLKKEGDFCEAQEFDESVLPVVWRQGT